MKALGRLLLIALILAGIVTSPADLVAQSGGGTIVPDTYFQSGRPWCDVRSEGAIGAANPAQNDRPAFSACLTKLNALAAAGFGTIYVPPGNYCITDGFDLSAQTNGIRIVGSGNGSVISSCGNDVTVIKLGGTFSTIENLYIGGKGVNTGAGPGSFAGGFNNAAVVFAQSCVGCRMQHTTVLGGAQPILVTTADVYLDDVFAQGGYVQATSLMILSATSPSAVWVNRGKFDHSFGTGVVPCSPTSSTFSVTATITGTDMNVTAITSGTIHVGDSVLYTGIASNGSVTVVPTGGGTGHYTLSGSLGNATGVNVTCIGNNPPAWAATTYYPKDQLVFIGNYYIQASQAGTSGGSQPALNNYGTTISDGGVNWLLTAPTAGAGVYCGQNCFETAFDATDISGMFGDASFAMNDATAGYAKFTNSVLSNLLGGQNVKLAAGARFAISNSEIFSCSFVTCPNIFIGPSFGGQVDIINNFIGAGYHNILPLSGTFNIIGNSIGPGQFGVNLGTAVSNFSIIGNSFFNLNGQGVNVNVGASNHYRIVGNNCAASVGLCVQDLGTGTDKFVDTIGQFQGTAAGDNANAGNIGEYIASNCPTPATMTATVTITIASPAVITDTGHGFSNTNGRADACPVAFTTSGSLPTGITSGTIYYVVPSSITTNTYQIATSVANALAGTSVNTSGSQSGTQTRTRGTNVATATAVNTSGLTLTPGDWDVWASSSTNGLSGTCVIIYSGINTVSGNLPYPQQPNNGAMVVGSCGLDGLTTLPVGMTRMSFSSTTNVYLVQQLNYSSGAGTVQGGGFIGARRRR